MNKRTFGIVFLMIMLVLGLYLNMPRTKMPDLNISIQVNLKVSSQTDQGT